VGRSVVAGRGEPGARVAWIGRESQNGVTAPVYSRRRRAAAEAVVGRSVVAGRGEPGARVAWIGRGSNLLARFDFGPDQLIYSIPTLNPISTQHVTVNLTSVPQSNFSSAGNLVGLVFNINEGVNIPAGTVFTFNSTIPEPGSVALLGLGALVGLASRRRRMAKPSSRS